MALGGLKYALLRLLECFQQFVRHVFLLTDFAHNFRGSRSINIKNLYYNEHRILKSIRNIILAPKTQKSWKTAFKFKSCKNAECNIEIVLFIRNIRFKLYNFKLKTQNNWIYPNSNPSILNNLDLQATKMEKILFLGLAVRKISLLSI